MHRLFVALRPPPALRRHLLDHMEGIAGVRWQEEGQLHLTLRFIGEVERPHAEEIAAALSNIDHPRPRLALNGAGLFGKTGSSRTLWAGVGRDDALATLRDRIERALLHTGLAPDRRAFHPHITLARLPATMLYAAVPPLLAGLASAPVELDHFLLVETLLGKDRASHSTVARYPLR
jgi:RNA 2',3'-cyclic 3'-phosphodiesterase